MDVTPNSRWKQNYVLLPCVKVRFHHVHKVFGSSVTISRHVHQGESFAHSEEVHLLSVTLTKRQQNIYQTFTVPDVKRKLLAHWTTFSSSTFYKTLQHLWIRAAWHSRMVLERSSFQNCFISHRHRTSCLVPPWLLHGSSIVSMGSSMVCPWILEGSTLIFTWRRFWWTCEFSSYQ